MPQNGPCRIFVEEPGDSQVSGHCGEEKHRGLAVLVCSVPELTRHGLRRASMSIPRWGGCCKSVVLSVSLALGKSLHWSCLPLVCHVKVF